MKRRLKVIGAVGVCIVLSIGVAGCTKKESIYLDLPNTKSVEEEVISTIEESSKTEGSSEGQFYNGANLSGRVVDFSDTGFTITPRTLIVNADGSMEGGIAAPGYESEEDNITITYTEYTVFQIAYFSMSAQVESKREDTDKSSIKKETDVDIFGTCQDENRWVADKIIITRWQ